MDIPDITKFRARYKELEEQIGHSDFYSDRKTAMAVSREHQKMGTLLEKEQQMAKILTNIESSKAILADPSSDGELCELAEEEINDGQRLVEKLRGEMLMLMIPPDPSDSRNTVFEIRAGTGGEEASLFAADLYRMYTKFAESMGWKIEVMSTSVSDTGGIKEVIFLISGEDVYKFLKFESGVHRVQRVPVTEANGRIHTSAATVAVLPEAEEIDITISPDDLEISVCRASGPGGQGVNTTDSAVQILHKPSGVTVYCADERSQQKNKVKAMKVLRSRLLQQKEEEERAKYAQTRKNQIGLGDRSERIRTYNIPQNRLTDHRIGLTLYSLPQIMEGEIGEIIDALQKADLRAKIESLGDQ
ncbi:MAG: peptide chain release factor 1 [Puniceicoccales bacterium]|jgi:peptide chain release factor 1|nr:peptide chain release factor 1 [Puniceicoccales bacterium]